MNYLTQMDSNKYVISLDSLDMGLLPTYTARPVNSATLWTASLNINTKDYFEFHIESKTETDAFDDDDSTVSVESIDSINENQSIPSTSNSTHRDETTTICHICDIDLPAAYITDHENSLKHKAYLKITDAVLSRSRKHILKKGNGYVRKNHLTYFCGPCASEVTLDDKHTHENSKTHKKSASLDRLLFELVTLYTNHEHEELSTSNTIDDENYMKNGFDDEIDDNIVVISDSKARLEEFEAKTILNYKELAHEFGLDKLYTLSNVGNDLKISRANGFEVIVSEDNFNGFIQIDQDHKFCIVCKMIVEEENIHKFSDAHIKSITKPFKDDNFIRNLDNSRNHCVICNKIVNDTNFHIDYDKTHRDLLHLADLQALLNENKPKVIQEDPIIEVNNQDMLPDPEPDSIHNGLDKDLDNSNRCIIAPVPKRNVTTKSDSFTKIDSETYLCNPCNLELHVNNIESHEIGNKHAMNLKSAVHYNMTRNIGSVNLTCKVCNIYVADNVDKVKAHVATNDHVKKYTDLLANNHVIVKRGNFYCKPCDLVILKKNELYHIEKSTHDTNLLSFEERTVKFNITQSTNISKADSNVQLHASHKSSDKTKFDSNISQPSSINSKQNDIKPYHEECKKVPNNLNNTLSNNDKNNILKTVKKEAHSIHDSESLEVHCLMEATDNEKSLMCKVCKVVVPNLEDNIKEHVKGKKHDAAFKSVMDANDIECAGEKYFCKICTENIETRNIFKHLNKKKHLVLLGNVIETETVEAVESFELGTNEKEIDNNSVTSTIDNASVDALFSKFKHHFLQSNDRHWLKCRVCIDMVMPYTEENLASHSSSEAHIDGYNNLMSRNLMHETEDGRHYCAACDCFIPRTGEVRHAQGSRHTSNFEIFMSRIR